MADKSCPPVPSDEITTRFALDKAYFRSSDGTAKHNAFMPSDGEVSVFRIAELSQASIWILGNRQVAEPRGKHLLGRLDLLTSHALATGALVCVDEPPARHAAIRGFPNEPERVKQRAIDLAHAARFRAYEE
jgi:hypothetical protein